MYFQYREFFYTRNVSMYTVNNKREFSKRILRNTRLCLIISDNEILIDEYKVYGRDGGKKWSSEKPYNIRIIYSVNELFYMHSIIQTAGLACAGQHQLLFTLIIKEKVNSRPNENEIKFKRPSVMEYIRLFVSKYVSCICV